MGNSGTIKVNGTQYNSPTTQFQVVEGNTITAEAQYYYHINGIDYTFTNWSDGSTSLSKTFTINTHNQITANYRGKPTNNGENIHFGSLVGAPIEIYWTDNPNVNVTQYQIWRKVKHNGVVGSERLIGTVGRGVGRYVDYDYVLTSSYTDDLLMYDVRAYYSVEGTYSDPNYESVYGAEALFKKGGESKPVEYSMEVYPNPFNPSTTISYQLPEKSIVTIKVYDMLGREVKELIEEIKEAGYYKLEFNGSELSSGIYICTIRANKFNKSIKLMLIK
ncbi:MAG: T9SS type A sorting domain-containing protein [Melioribacter sp.]|uniref:T9SS type A sorting domain-containing protein n=1 Tax=Rosettibacter primus TaxID=3111523 RepID=UPI00247CF204|nr:T9SS type A sorting domain-containing protein [Melioribacter sp.]